MLSSKKTKGLVIIVFLFIGTTANSAPTLSNCNGKFIADDVIVRSYVYTFSKPEINQCTEAYNSHLENISTQFLKPPISNTDSNTSSSHVKSLPSVPGALIMTLTGFLCVSLVNDRKFWFAALAGLLWLGQTGFCTLPHFASHLASKKHVEQQFISSQEFQQCDKIFSYHHRNTCIYQSATILKRDKLNPLFNCLTSTIEQTPFYSSAFIFAHSARGPPERT